MTVERQSLRGTGRLHNAKRDTIDQAPRFVLVDPVQLESFFE
jgi:hypothetical protein